MIDHHGIAAVTRRRVRRVGRVLVRTVAFKVRVGTAVVDHVSGGRGAPGLASPAATANSTVSAGHTRTIVQAVGVGTQEAITREQLIRRHDRSLNTRVH